MPRDISRAPSRDASAGVPARGPGAGAPAGEDARAPASAVPHVVHQTWRTSELPPLFEELRSSWSEERTGWRSRLWNDTEMGAFAAREFPWFMRKWRAYPSGVQRADAWRYMVMYAEGGVYADLDFELLKPMDEYVERLARQDGGCALGQEPLEHVLLLERRDPAERRAMACNALLVSAPCHPFWLHVLRAAVSKDAHADPVSSTGPRLVSETLERLARQGRSDEECRVEDASAFYPAFDSRYQRDNIRGKCGVLLRGGAARGDEGGGGRGAGGPGERLGGDGGGLSGAARDDTAAAALGMPLALVPRARALCESLRSRNFSNPTKEQMRETSYAVHHWVHTWIDGYHDLKSNI
eukprot:PRCOL_00001854-RA